MTKIKKMMAVVLAAVLTLAMAITAAAGTITINNAQSGQTYNAYKIFDVSFDGTAYAYTIKSDSPWYSTVSSYASGSGSGMTLEETSVTGVYSVVFDTEVKDGSLVVTNYDAAKFAETLKKALDDGLSVTADGTTIGAATEGDTTTMTVITAGYYLVTSSLGSLCALNTANADATVEEKNTLPRIDKAPLAQTAEVGEAVKFTVTVTADGENSKEGNVAAYVVYDKMSAGLSLITNDSSYPITIKKNDAEIASSNYTLDTTATTTSTFSVTFSEDYTHTLAANDVITIEYYARVTSDILTEGNQTGNNSATNKAWLTAGETTKNAQECTVKNYGFDLVKTFIKDSTHYLLDGAEFKLYESDGTTEVKLIAVNDTVDTSKVAYYRPIEEGETAADKIVVSGGVVRIDGLSGNTYKLKEETAPSGYNKLEKAIDVTLTADNYATYDTTAGTYTQGGVEVENSKGIQPPATGGMGTKMLYGAGAVMVLAAAVLLITKRRMS